MIGITPAYTMLDWAAKKRREEQENKARRNRNSERVRPINVLSRSKTHRVEAILPDNMVQLAPVHAGLRGGRVRLNEQTMRILREGDYVRVS